VNPASSRCPTIPFHHHRFERGPLHFQDISSSRAQNPVVRGIRFAGVESTRPAPGVLEAIATADRIIICPAPADQHGPILAVPQVRDQLRANKVRSCCFPIVGRKIPQGPSDKILALRLVNSIAEQQTQQLAQGRAQPAAAGTAYRLKRARASCVSAARVSSRSEGWQLYAEGGDRGGLRFVGGVDA